MKLFNIKKREGGAALFTILFTALLALAGCEGSGDSLGLTAAVDNGEVQGNTPAVNTPTQDSTASTGDNTPAIVSGDNTPAVSTGETQGNTSAIASGGNTSAVSTGENSTPAAETGGISDGYKVTLNAGTYGIPQEDITAKGNTAVALPNPSDTNPSHKMAFAGWYEGDTLVASPYTVNKDVTLTAKWVLYEGRVELRENEDTKSYVAMCPDPDNKAALAGEIVIPSYVNDKPVTEVDANGFGGCTNITGVVIPDTVTQIGTSAFGGCTSLASVSLGNAVKCIDATAFHGCTALTSVALPASLTKIGLGAFMNSGLTSVFIPAGVTEIGDRHSGKPDPWGLFGDQDGDAFDGCASLTAVEVDKDNKRYFSDNGVLYRKSEDGQDNKKLFDPKSQNEGK